MQSGIISKNDLGGNTTPPIELQLLRVDGSSVIVEGRGVKTTIKGKPAIQVAIRDITERKRLNWSYTKMSGGSSFSLIVLKI